ncbi:hypothetical protein [Streptomyces sp. NPDC086519]|uniref:hypothetical protein n=1 Tax=Streptomyces sp. NPDC086519 TaxID=3154863 RepID=UPI003445EBD1
MRQGLATGRAVVCCAVRRTGEPCECLLGFLDRLLLVASGADSQATPVVFAFLYEVAGLLSADGDVKQAPARQRVVVTGEPVPYSSFVVLPLLTGVPLVVRQLRHLVVRPACGAV